MSESEPGAVIVQIENELAKANYKDYERIEVTHGEYLEFNPFQEHLQYVYKSIDGESISNLRDAGTSTIRSASKFILRLRDKLDEKKRSDSIMKQQLVDELTEIKRKVSRD